MTAFPLIIEAAHANTAWIQDFPFKFCLKPPVEATLALYLTEKQLELRDLSGTFTPLAIDFVQGAFEHRRRFGGGRRQALGRAIGLKPHYNPHIIDATAGMGQDSCLLATLGCHVLMLERSPVIAALLQDALQRAATHFELLGLRERLQWQWIDAATYLQTLPASAYPDVIYLDPMYPTMPKSALNKKAMRLFRNIVGEDIDAATLLPLARTRARRRVVVKRPHAAPPLANTPPDTVITGESTRFDVYLTPQI